MYLIFNLVYVDLEVRQGRTVTGSHLDVTFCVGYLSDILCVTCLELSAFGLFAHEV